MKLNIFSRYYQYSKERFPLKNFIPLSVIFAISASIGTQVYLYGEVKDKPLSLIAFFALFCFFLRLRIFDEFKDFNHDLLYYPTRPVQRGLVKLKELRSVLFVILFFEVIIATSQGVNSFIAFLVALFYSLLMLKEFFVKDWLRKHFTAYIISHEVLIFPLFFYLFSLNGFGGRYISEPYFWWLTSFLGAQLFLLEMTRKIKPKELEISSRDTYTAQYGVKGASLLILCVSLIATISTVFAKKLLRGDATPLDYVPMLLFMGVVMSVLTFIRKPSEHTASKVFNLSIFFVFLTNLIFIFSIIKV